jgi:hypothetical protein
MPLTQRERRDEKLSACREVSGGDRAQAQSESSLALPHAFSCSAAVACRQLPRKGALASSRCSGFWTLASGRGRGQQGLVTSHEPGAMLPHARAKGWSHVSRHALSHLRHRGSSGGHAKLRAPGVGSRSGGPRPRVMRRHSWQRPGHFPQSAASLFAPLPSWGKQHAAPSCAAATAQLSGAGSACGHAEAAQPSRLGGQTCDGTHALCRRPASAPCMRAPCNDVQPSLRLHRRRAQHSTARPKPHRMRKATQRQTAGTRTQQRRMREGEQSVCSHLQEGKFRMRQAVQSHRERAEKRCALSAPGGWRSEGREQSA